MSYSNFIVEFSKLNELLHETNILFNRNLEIILSNKNIMDRKISFKDENKIIILIETHLSKKNK